MFAVLHGSGGGAQPRRNSGQRRGRERGWDGEREGPKG